MWKAASGAFTPLLTATLTVSLLLPGSAAVVPVSCASEPVVNAECQYPFMAAKDGYTGIQPVCVPEFLANETATAFFNSPDGVNFTGCDSWNASVSTACSQATSSETAYILSIYVKCNTSAYSTWSNGVWSMSLEAEVTVPTVPTDGQPIVNSVMVTGGVPLAPAIMPKCSDVPNSTYVSLDVLPAGLTDFVAKQWLLQWPKYDDKDFLGCDDLTPTLLDGCITMFMERLSYFLTLRMDCTDADAQFDNGVKTVELGAFVSIDESGFKEAGPVQHWVSGDTDTDS